MSTATITFPIEDTDELTFEEWLEVVDYMKENGDTEEVQHIAEQLGIDTEAEPSVQKAQLAQLLLRVSKLYAAGDIIEAIDRRS